MALAVVGAVAMQERASAQLASGTHLVSGPQPVDAVSGDITRAAAVQNSLEVPTLETTTRPAQHTLVSIPSNRSIYNRPGGRAISTLPARSLYLNTPTTAWVMRTSADGAWGLVPMPWSRTTGSATGWIKLTGLNTSTTAFSVVASVSRREILVQRRGKTVLRIAAGVGRPGSPTPTGTYYVTDRVDIGTSAPNFGTYAFGLSGRQPNLPVGWTGKDQLAIHGTSDPSSIGTQASAGCFRVSERALDQLKPLLRLGTPVTITA